MKFPPDPAKPCPFCDETHPGICPRVKSVHTDVTTGALTAIEFHNPARASAIVAHIAEGMGTVFGWAAGIALCAMAYNWLMT